MAFTYLDNNAGTGLAEGVLDAMLPYLQQQQGNPSSSHRFGRFNRAAIDKARKQVAALVNVAPEQVIFTSGGTEANNQALAGIVQLFGNGKLLVSSVEHPAIIEPAKRLQQQGFDLDMIPVNQLGQVTTEGLSASMDEQTRLVAIMWANNETGTIQNVMALADICQRNNVFFLCDAVQAAGKLAIDFNATGIDLLTLSAHKFGGPKGIGALIVSKKLDWPAYILGGGQEDDHRSGTENVASIAGFGAAAEFVHHNLDAYQQHCQLLRNELETQLHDIDGITIFAEEAERLVNTVYFSIPGFDADTLLMALDRHGFSVSSGSACGTGRQIPSHVLTAMGIDATTALGAVRVSLSMQNTVKQIEQFVAVLKAEAERFNHLMNR